MTVCIAAIYNNNSIICVSDRMITGGYGDITFEPPIPKILQFTSAITALTAGDQNIQMQVYNRTRKMVDEKIAKNPEEWLSVADVARMYSDNFYEVRAEMIEGEVLSQYGLTMDSFIAKQKEMNQVLVNTLTNRIDRFQTDHMGSINTVITGIDDVGGLNTPHIYVIRNGKISCHDKLGFTSIGIGASHAISHFMLSSYSRFESEPKALLTIHQAKKKSEVSPGVGHETDMCIIGPGKGQFTSIVPIKGLNILKDLDGFYEAYTRKIKHLDKSTEKKIQDYLKKISSPPNVEQKAIS